MISPPWEQQPGSTLLSQLTTLVVKSDVEASLAPREITPLVPALASKLLSWYSSFSSFMDGILCWTSCSGMSVHVLHSIYSIIFTFSFYLLPWSLLSFSFYSVVPAHKLSLWDGIYLWFLCQEYYKESQADLPVFCYPELRAFSGTLH